MLDEMIAGQVPKEKPKVRVKDVYERPGGQERDRHRTV